MHKDKKKGKYMKFLGKFQIKSNDRQILVYKKGVYRLAKQSSVWLNMNWNV